MHCLTPSATYSTCSTSTRGSWQIIPRMGRKKVDRWRHLAELVNQGATLGVWCFCPAFREWLHDARCFHLEGCHQIGKLLMCAPDMLHPFQLGSGLTMTYHDLPTAVYKVVRGWNARTNISKSVVGSSSSVPLGRNGFDACFELLVHLIPLQQGTLRTGDARDA